MRLRREESDCMRARGEQAAERENSLAAQTKRYGDILKHVLPRMPSDPGEIVNFFGTCENLWELYDDPNGLRAKLLLPLLTAKAKLLINRLMLLAMFSRSKTFCSVSLSSLVASIKPLQHCCTLTWWDTCFIHQSAQEPLGFYMKSRECDNFDKLVDLIVADRLKDSLSGPCLKYCLSLEGSKAVSYTHLTLPTNREV